MYMLHCTIEWIRIAVLCVHPSVVLICNTWLHSVIILCTQTTGYWHTLTFILIGNVFTFSNFFQAGFHLLWVGLRLFLTGHRRFLAGRCLISSGIHTGFHPFLMGVHLGRYFFLNGLCPDLVGIHAGDESNLNDWKLLIIGFISSSILASSLVVKYFFQFLWSCRPLWICWFLFRLTFPIDLRLSWLPSRPAFFSWLVFIYSRLVLTSSSRGAIICSTSCYRDVTIKFQWSFQSEHFWRQLPLDGLTIDGVWVGCWTYCLLMRTSRNCKQLQRHP